MTRAGELRAAISELDEAVDGLKAIEASETKSRSELQKCSTAICHANVQLQQIMYARYSG